MGIVPSNKISVVIQGPLHRASSEYGVEITINSIKKWLPEAEIIVSTWVGEDTKGLNCHQLIVSEPPEKLIDKNGNPNYLGHQILSTQFGLALSTRAYVLKMRADHSLLNNDFCIYPDKVVKSEPFAFFDKKIIVSSLFLRDPLKVPFLFHISDLIQFGKRSDVIAFWSLKAPTLEEILQKNPRGHVGLFGNYSSSTLFKQAPEQTIILSLLKANGINVNLPYPCATNYKWFFIWEHVLAKNFQVVDASKSNVVYPKRFHKAFLGESTVLNQVSFTKLVKTPGSRLRYFKLLLNKYIFAWGQPRYWIATSNILLSYVFPEFAQKIRIKLRNRLGLVHGDRK